MSAEYSRTDLVVWVTLGIGVALILGSFIVAALLGRGRPAARMHALLRRIPSERLRNGLDEKLGVFSESDRATAALFGLGARKSALPVVACVLAWVCEALETWLILALLGVSLRFDAVLGIDMAVSLARQTMFLLPAGIGVQEAGYMSALSALGVSDVLTVGAAFLVLKRGKEIFWITVGILTLFLLPAWRSGELARREAAPASNGPASKAPVSNGPASKAPASHRLAAPHSASG